MEKKTDINVNNQMKEELKPETKDPAGLQEEIVKEWQEKYQRLAADFANYKNRITREWAELEDRLKAKWLISILNIFEDFTRLNNHQNHLVDLNEGIQALQKQWLQWFEENDVQIMHPEGEGFDHEYHDAVLNLPVNEPELNGKIVQVVENGYLFKNKVLRHAKVAIGRYENK